MNSRKISCFHDQYACYSSSLFNTEFIVWIILTENLGVNFSFVFPLFFLRPYVLCTCQSPLTDISIYYKLWFLYGKLLEDWWHRGTKQNKKGRQTYKSTIHRIILPHSFHTEWSWQYYNRIWEPTRLETFIVSSTHMIELFKHVQNSKKNIPV